MDGDMGNGTIYKLNSFLNIGCDRKDGSEMYIKGERFMTGSIREI